MSSFSIPPTSLLFYVTTPRSQSGSKDSTLGNLCGSWWPRAGPLLINDIHIVAKSRIQNKIVSTTERRIENAFGNRVVSSIASRVPSRIANKVVIFLFLYKIIDYVGT